jgi:hypothetical protein
MDDSQIEIAIKDNVVILTINGLELPVLGYGNGSEMIIQVSENVVYKAKPAFNKICKEQYKSLMTEGISPESG